MSNENPIQIKITDEKLALVYSNHIRIGHAPEEFVLEISSVFPPSGTVISRVAISPAHAKRLLKVLAENVQGYEEKFGVIKEMPIPFNLGDVNQK
jgi:hypothetical protein